MLKDFDFDLPEELIAKYPLDRGKSRLLHRSQDGQLSDMNFSQISDLLQPGDLLVLNNTRVIPSCLRGYTNNSELKINFISRINDCEGERWEFLSKPRKKAVLGSVIQFSDRLIGVVIEKFNQNELDVIEFFTLEKLDESQFLVDRNNQKLHHDNLKTHEKISLDESQKNSVIQFLVDNMDDELNLNSPHEKEDQSQAVKNIQELINCSARKTINTRDYLLKFDSLESAIESGISRNSLNESIIDSINQFKIEEQVSLKTPSQVEFFNLLDSLGEMPLPPYMKRSATDNDKNTYQTVFSQVEGSVAAPTAGLHFSRELLDEIQSRGVKIAYVTLHIGGGTFLPVRVENISQHKMHSEFYSIDAATCDLINNARLNNNRIIAVGTTVARTLESAAEFCGSENLYQHSRHTDIFIRDKYKFKVVDCLITNFHLPKSTLFMLICSFVGCTEAGQELYRHAIDAKYRFFSYGDACFLER